MKNSIRTVEKILNRFRFTEPVNQDLQEHIRRAKSDQFAKILDSAGGGSLFFTPVYRFFFFMKSAGFSTTITKSAVILITAGVLFLSGISAGLYFTLRTDPVQKHSVLTKAEDKGISILQDKVSLEKTRESIHLKPAAGTIHGARLFSLTGNGVPEETCKAITDSIYTQLNSMGGERTVTMGGTGKTSPFIILGEVDTLDKSLTISLRLVEKKTGKIAAYGQEQADSKKDISAACQNLSKTIFKGIRKLREETR